MNCSSEMKYHYRLPANKWYRITSAGHYIYFDGVEMMFLQRYVYRVGKLLIHIFSMFPFRVHESQQRHFTVADHVVLYYVAVDVKR